MISIPYDSDLAPKNVYSWSHPGLTWFRYCNLYKFLDKIDSSRVSIYLNVNSLNGLPRCHTTHAIFTSFGESPRLETLKEFSSQHPDTKIIWLGDFEVYDYPLPANVTFLPYRHWIWWLDWFITSRQVTPTPVKQKKLNKKFSSLSFKKTQMRALLTCFLLSRADDQSVVSWHNIDNPGVDDFIKALKSHAQFVDLDWDLLNSPILIDDFSWGHNTCLHDLVDMHHPAYQQCLINLNNETEWRAWPILETREPYLMPGPYVTEKTWKTLLSGCVLINSGPANLLRWLETEYHITCDWSIPRTYDQVLPDMVRATHILQTLELLCEMDLSDLVDQNIDACERIQNQLLGQDYVTEIYKFNLQQDMRIANLCSCL